MLNVLNDTAGAIWHIFAIYLIISLECCNCFPLEPCEMSQCLLCVVTLSSLDTAMTLSSAWSVLCHSVIMLCVVWQVTWCNNLVVSMKCPSVLCHNVIMLCILWQVTWCNNLVVSMKCPSVLCHMSSCCVSCDRWHGVTTWWWAWSVLVSCVTCHHAVCRVTGDMV